MNPDQPKLEAQRQAVRRSRAQGRRWIYRAAALAAVAGVAFYRGGSFNNTLGVALAVVVVLAAHLGRQLRRAAADMERKITLMESADAQIPQDLRPDT